VFAWRAAGGIGPAAERPVATSRALERPATGRSRVSGMAGGQEESGRTARAGLQEAKQQAYYTAR
jgi:hypothetical protein